MAADENKQIVKDLFAAFGRGDIAVLRALVAQLEDQGPSFGFPGQLPPARNRAAPG